MKMKIPVKAMKVGNTLFVIAPVVPNKIRIVQ